MDRYKLLEQFLLAYRNISALEYAELLADKLKAKSLLIDDIAKTILETTEEYIRKPLINNADNEFKFN